MASGVEHVARRTDVPSGRLALVLHAHLPFVRHPEHARHLEERWLYEALLECYLPLLGAFDRLAADGVPFALTMSVTPPLAAMLRDPLLQERFERHLARVEALAEKEMKRLWGDARFAPVATFYRDEARRAREVWERHDRDPLGGFVRHADAGSLDLLTCSATHCYLPGMIPAREGIRPQLELGVRGWERIVGRTPHGMWLPECAYDPSFDADIAAAGIRYTLVDTHGITHARPRSPFGVHAPIVSPAGVAFFGRDAESSRQVWSRDEGYPGDPYYRDFYRDIGFDLPPEDLMGEVAGDGSRLMTGLKYFRITGSKENPSEKEPYQPGVAAQRAKEHAANFVFNRAAQMRHLAKSMPGMPIVVAPYDAELYGQWWVEGPQFLEHVFREIPKTNGEVVATTLRGYLDENPVAIRATPSPSSWGAGGYGEVWVGPAAAWSWRHVHHATRYVAWLVRLHREAQGPRGEALDQAIRELLLLQSSDWNFILHTATSAKYAEGRIRAHVHRLRHLGHLVETGRIEGHDAEWVADVRKRDNFLGQMKGEELRGAFA
jgi:1,4-alpha-glucan branching enzyme